MASPVPVGTLVTSTGLAGPTGATGPGGSTVTISDTAPASPTPGNLWFDSIGGQLYLYYQDPNTSQWVVANTGFVGPSVMPPGVIDGSNAAAGQVGEYIQSVQSSNVSLAANTAVNLTTLVLSAGDWDVQAQVYFGVSTPTTYLQAGISTTSLTIGPGVDPGGWAGVGSSNTTVGGGTVVAIGPCRYNVTAPTTLYLVAQNGTGTNAAQGRISARRMR